MIDMLMDPSAVKGHSLPTLEELSDELAMLLTAGSDTSSNAIISGIYYICHHVDVYQRLFEELQDAFPFLDTDITYENTRKLPYLVSTLAFLFRRALSADGNAASCHKGDSPSGPSFTGPSSKDDTSRGVYALRPSSTCWREYHSSVESTLFVKPQLRTHAGQHPHIGLYP